MRLHKFTPALAALALAAFMAEPTSAQDRSGFSLGLQGGYTDWGDEYGSTTTGAVAGVVAEALAPLGGDIYAGLQIGGVKETAELSESITFPLLGTLKVVQTVELSLDVMPTIVYSPGPFFVGLSAGFSMVRGELEGEIVGTESSDSASNWHKGWKIAPSIGFNVSENVTAYIQLHYAKYGEEEYDDVVKIKPESVGSRLGVLLNF